MFNITIEINQKCNLRCNYCYVTNKDGKEMSYDIAIKAIDYALTEAQQFSDNTLQINFIGGEPLLSFVFMDRIIDYVEMSKEATHIIYSISTNGILLTDAIMEYLIKYKFLIKISLDGTANSNDINRVDHLGKGSYEKVICKLRLLKNYEVETGNIIQVTNVITNNNYQNFYNNIFHLTHILGFQYIDTGFDVKNMSINEYQCLGEQIDRIFDLYKNSVSTEKAFNFSFIEKCYFNMIKPKSNSFFSCRGGIVGAYIKSDGKIYACPKAIEVEIGFGSVLSGLDLGTLLSINSLDNIDNEVCTACKFNKICSNRRCIFNSMTENGDINKPSEFGCWLAKKSYNIIENNKDFFDNLFLRRMK